MPKDDKVEVADEDEVFGPDVDTHQVQRLDEANRKAAETAAVKMNESGDSEGEDLTATAAEVQSEQLSDTKPPADA